MLSEVKWRFGDRMQGAQQPGCVSHASMRVINNLVVLEMGKIAHFQMIKTWKYYLPFH